MAEIKHGGDIYRNKVKLDFSININPLGMPKGVEEALHEAVAKSICYPDPKAEALMAAVADLENVPISQLICGNGASELLTAMVHTLKPKQVLMPVPSFLGYEQAAGATDAVLNSYPLKMENGFALDSGIISWLTPQMDILFLTNPNNPVGNCMESGLLEKIIEQCRQKEIFVVLDECFLDFTGRKGFFVTHDPKDYPHVAVLRAFTKIYAIPGVRLGYMISGNEQLMTDVKKHLPEWNLSVFAQMAGVAAVKEKIYRKETVRLIAEGRRQLDDGLRALGLKTYPGEADFILFEGPKGLADGLLKEGILIRDCANYKGLAPGFYRICVRKPEEQNVLLEAIRRYMNHE